MFTLLWKPPPLQVFYLPADAAHQFSLENSTYEVLDHFSMAYVGLADTGRWFQELFHFTYLQNNNWKLTSYFIFTVYLNGLFLWGQCVDNSDSSCFSWKHTNAVWIVLPPWSTKVICPVCARTLWRSVYEPSSWCVVEFALGYWVNVSSDLEGKIVTVL